MFNLPTILKCNTELDRQEAQWYNCWDEQDFRAEARTSGEDLYFIPDLFNVRVDGGETVSRQRLL